MGATLTRRSSGMADLTAEMAVLPGFSMLGVSARFLRISGRFGFAAVTKLVKDSNSTSLPKFANGIYDTSMTTMNISLPDSLKDFVDEQVEQRGYGTSSEYVRELIRKEQDRLQLRELLLEGAASAPTKPVDDAYFDGLRRKVKVSKSGSRR
jgi:antitoxin ParD1/3/4